MERISHKRVINILRNIKLYLLCLQLAKYPKNLNLENTDFGKQK